MRYRNKFRKKSPIKEKPLRNPGESLQEEYNRVITEWFLPLPTIIIMLLIFSLYEWVRYFRSAPPQPLLWTSTSFLFTIYFLIKVKKDIHYCKALNKGILAEKSVGQCLEDLRRQDCRIFHDIDCGGFNIDHVVVSPRGIFVIETKYKTKNRGSYEIEFDGSRLTENKIPLGQEPIKQVRALKDWLRDLLLETTGHKYPVLGVVVYPGWYIKHLEKQETSDVRVLNPKLLLQFIGKRPVILKKEDISLISSRIADLVRNHA